MATFWWMFVLAFVPTIFCGYSFRHTSHVSVFGSLNSECNETIPCNVTDSDCYKGKCECRLGYTSDKNETKCLKFAVALHDTCEEDVQCRLFLGSYAKCQNNKCVCDSFQHYVNGKCSIMYRLGEYCSSWSGMVCLAGSEYQAASCQEGRCKCSDGFYQRDSNNCRRKIKNEGDECLLDLDCDFDNASCVKHKCVSDGKPMNASHVEIGREFIKNEGVATVGSICDSDYDCESIGNSICDVDGTCICKRAHFPSKDNTSCVPEIGEVCDPNNQGVHVEHAVCRENMWTCPIDRYRTNYNRECRELAGDIGGICQDAEQCQLIGPGGECYLNRCLCPNHSHYDEKEHYCRLDLGASCKIDSDCELANSHCRDNTCSCVDNYFDHEGQCVKGLGVRCGFDKDCKYVNNSSCQGDGWSLDSYCKCLIDFVAEPNNFGLCLPKLQLLEECQYNGQCSESVAHTFCNFATRGEKGRCECVDGYFSKDGDCYKKKDLGNECEESKECLTPNSRCKDGFCNCLPAHIALEDKCVLELGARCEDNNDCDMPGSYCRENECQCEKWFNEVNNKCVAGLGGSCQNNDDCKHVNNTMCHKNVCECEPNHLNVNPFGCLPKLQYHQECKRNEQCQATIPWTFCNVTEGEVPICECSSDFYFKQNTCYPKKYLGGDCTEPDQCFDKNSFCKDGQCVCLPSFKEKNKQCNSAGIARPLFSIIAFILLGLKTLF